MTTTDRLLISILNELQKQKNEIKMLNERINNIYKSLAIDNGRNIEQIENRDANDNYTYNNMFKFPNEVYEQLYISSSENSETSSIISNTDYQKDIINNK